MDEAVPSFDIEDMRRMVIRLSRLVEISVTLNSTLDLDRLLQFIIESAADLLESEEASILLADEKTHELCFVAATGSDPSELRKIPVPLEGSIAGTVFRDDEPLIINEVEGDSRHFSNVSEAIDLEVRSLIAVPLRIRDKVTGVLEALNKRHGRFDEMDLQTLSNIASQAAVAVNNARLVEALKRAYDELGELDRLKSDFIAIASHELRTPLGLIMGYAALLKEGTDTKASEHADAVLSSALRMRALIEAMTNMNMLQAGSAEMETAETSLQKIVQAAHDEVIGLVETKGQTFTLQMPETPIVTLADERKLTLALVNVLNNSMRFTPADGHINLMLERKGREAWIEVSDDGIGIPAEQLDRIFIGFYQVDDHMKRRYEGLGLGLAIAKAIVEAHHGRIWAESDGVGHGCTITMALPLTT
jgi:signal transduction histidine kinase